MADRYAYVSFIGLVSDGLLGCGGVGAEMASSPSGIAGHEPCGIVILSVITHRQVGYWSDSVTLWTHTLEVTHRNWVADVRLGTAFRQRGQTDEALSHLHRAAEDRPKDPDIALAIALIEHERGNRELALQYYEQALANSYNEVQTAQVLANMGHIYSELGDYTRARECYRSAVRPPPPRPAINWRGEWWRDLGPAIRQYFQKRPGNP